MADTESFKKLENEQEMDISTFIEIFSLKYIHPPSTKSIYDAFNILGINTVSNLIDLYRRFEENFIKRG